MKRILSLAGLLLALHIPSPVAAQSEPIRTTEEEVARVTAQARRAFSTGRYRDAMIQLRDVHAFAVSELGPRHVLTLRVLNDIAVIHQLQGDLDAALPLALQAAGGLERGAGPDHPETINALANLGQLRAERGEAAEAEPLMRRVLDARTRTLGGGDEATLNALLELAVFLKRQGRLREIAGQLERGAATARTSIGAESAIALDLTAAATEARGG